MKFTIPFQEEQLKYILEQYPKATIMDKNESFTFVEFNLLYDHEFSGLFYAGAKYGLHQSLNIKNQQS